MLSIKQRLKLIGLAFGIFISYCLMAYFQQKVYEVDYDGEKFKFATFFVAIQCAVYTIAARGKFLKLISG